MTTKVYEFAEIPVAVNAVSGAIDKLCHDYETTKEPLFTLTLTQADIDAERAGADAPGYTDGYLETLALYRKFCDRAVREGVLLFHSSAIEADGSAYLFTAPSGTGKSTHARLWRELLGECVRMINDDKPLLLVKDGEVRVFGTPWDGKHRLSTRTSAPVAGICFLKRGTENAIRKLSVAEATAAFLAQTYRPSDLAGAQAMLSAAVTVMTRVPLYELTCNISTDAARLSYETMKRGKTL